jgi:anti-sigma-K factor RskA
MATTDIHALAGAYVLDAVDDIERAAFTRHLAECESCRTEVDEMREATARLADSTWSVPSPRLRTDVMAAIARTRQVAPGAPAPAEREAGAVSRWRRFTAGAVAAGILAAGAGAATWAVQEQRVRDSEALVAIAAAKERRTQQILAAPDVQVRTTFLRDGGRVTVVMSPGHRAGVVMLAADAPPPPGKVFQMWTINAAGVTNAGVMPAGASSSVQIIDGLPGNDAFGVTVEPVGGSATPTVPTVAKVTLT